MKKNLHTLSCISLLAVARLTSLGYGGEVAAKPEIVWYDVSAWGVEGRAFGDEERFHYYDRFPAAAKESVRDKVWELSESPTGMFVRFETDAS